MRAGKLRHRLHLQAPTDTPADDAGNPDVTYATAATVWGSVEPLTVREQLQAQQVAATATHLVTIRFYRDLQHKWRIMFGQREFAIEAVMPTESRPIEMKLLVREEIP
jgi:SPP1 family predicted phage head-tail adaptor